MASRTTQFRRVAPALLERREAVRHVIEVQRSTVRKHGHKPVDATLVDISTFGCRVAVDIRVRPDDRLWLRFPGSQPVHAKVVWSDQGMIGCRFDSPIDRALTRALSLPVY